MTDKSIVYQVGDYSVRREQFGPDRLRPKSWGYSVYKDGATAATRVGQYGDGEKYLAMAIAEAKRRHASES